MSELFTNQELIDPKIEKTIKALRKIGFTDIDLTEHLLIHRLKITGRNELIPTLKKQIEMIKIKLDKTTRI